MTSHVEYTNCPVSPPVKQFSIFADNKVGKLNEIILMLSKHKVHIMALATVDTTDSSIVRLIVDYWEQAKNLFQEQGIHFALNDVVVVEMASEDILKQITCSLLQAEINIHYTYPMLIRPNGQYAQVMRTEDYYTATEVLNQNGLKTLKHHDITR